MSEKTKTYQNAFQIFKERYAKKLKKDKTLSQSEIDDMVLQRWKFLPNDQRQPYINRFEKQKKSLLENDKKEVNSEEEEIQVKKKVKE